MAAICIISTAIYCHSESNLSGPWILDDKGSVSMNPVVTGAVPVDEVWKRDFWGTHEMNNELSHKSWRPICTLTYIWNRRLAGGSSDKHTYWFHVTDRFLHGIVAALVIPVAGYTFTFHHDVYRHQQWIWVWGRSLITSLLFAAHPIHVESVANTTGRAEVLCALFYFLGFLVYAKVGSGLSLHFSSSSNDQNNNSTGTSKPQQYQLNCQSSILRSLIGVSFMLGFSCLSMLCKEHGITLPLMVIIWDAYIGTNTSVQEILNLCLCRHSWSNGNTSIATSDEKKKDEAEINHEKLDSGSRQSTRKMQCKLFLLRVTICIVACLCISFWRLSKNGTSKPDFVCEQNPAACESRRYIRFFHYSYLWCFNFWLLCFPSWLCPDWSGDSIPLFNEYWATDKRFGVVIIFWIFLMGFVLHTSFATCTNVYKNVVLLREEVDSTSKPTQRQEESEDIEYQLWRRTIITCIFWMILPFLMSSNLLIYVGFVVADRTLYLPSFGFCLLLTEILILFPSYVSINPLLTLHNVSTHSKKNKSTRTHQKFVTTFVTIIIISLYIWKQQRQTRLWSHPVLIWEEAYKINPKSILTGTEYGMALVNASRNKDAANVLQKCHKREVATNHFTRTIHHNDEDIMHRKDFAEIIRKQNLLRTRFKLVTAMGNSGSCEEAIPLILEGLQWIDDISRKLDPSNFIHDALSSSSSSYIASLKEGNLDNKAYFLVSKSRCSKTVAAMAGSVYDAFVIRPEMNYVIQHAESVSDIVKKLQSSGLDPNKVYTYWELNDNNQIAQLSFRHESD